MDENKNIPMEEEDVTILTLHDDEGNEEQFEFLDLVEYQGKQYIILFPVDDGDMEIVILQVEEIEGKKRLTSLWKTKPSWTACMASSRNGSRTNLSSKTDVFPFEEMQAVTARSSCSKRRGEPRLFPSAKRNTRPGSSRTGVSF